MNTFKRACGSFCGDLTTPQFGLTRDDYDRLIHTTDSVIHCAASLNRKSEKSCLNVNLRGTLEVLLLAQKSNYYHGLRRFSQVSTVAVAGKRQDEVVIEDRPSTGIGRTTIRTRAPRNSTEHMMRELLAGRSNRRFFGPASSWETAVIPRRRSSTW